MVITDGPPLAVVVDLHTPLSGVRTILQSHRVWVRGRVCTEDARILVVVAASRNLTPVRLWALEDAVFITSTGQVTQPDLKKTAEQLTSEVRPALG